jgi:hypothetical protein
LAVSEQIIMQLGEDADFLRRFILIPVSGLMRFRHGTDSECASNVVQIYIKKKVRWRPCLNLGTKRTGCCITTTHRLTPPFSTGNLFTKNDMTVVSHPPYFPVSPIGDKIESPPF